MKFFSDLSNNVKSAVKNIAQSTNISANKKKRRSYSDVAHSLRKNVTVAKPNGVKHSTGRVVRSSKKRGMNGVLVFFNSLKLNKKRFAVIVGVVAVAVALPVIVVAANAPMQQIEPVIVPKADTPKVEFAKDLDTNQVNASDVAGVSTAKEGISSETQITDEQITEATTLEVEGTAGVANMASENGIYEGTPTATEAPVTYIQLSDGMRDPEVKKIQARLMELNYMDNDEPTELYGSITAQAIGFFQRKHEIPMDGVAGETTQKLLFSPEAKPYSVTVGGEGADVSHIQERLRDLGYGVSASGYFGTDTEAAVKYFQRMNGLDDDGSVGAYTKEVLFSSGAEPALEKPKAKKTTKSGGSSSGGSSGGGGGGGSTSHVANPGTVSGFLDAAQALNGIPYVRGGKTSAGADCSGFIYVAMQNAGIGIGYMTSGGWASSGYPTVGSMNDLQPGDIVCFKGHVGIYLGGGSMIDASSSDGRVRICSNIQGSNYWTSNFICGKRPL